MASLPKIAIIGAGPAGLTLARLLHVSKPKIDLKIYELDASPKSRDNQGGTLDLHEDTGLATLRKCGLWDAFQKHARYDGDELIMADKNGTELIHLKGGSGNRPEIDRKLLKEILLESLPEEVVKWGRKLREVTEDGMLRFEGREEVDGPFDLVVGADGAWSKVRGMLTEVKPDYSGISGYEMDISSPKTSCPELDKSIGRGSRFGFSDRKALNAQRMGDGSVKVRSWFACPEGEVKTVLEKHGKKATLEKILGRYEGWASEMTELLRQADLETLRCWTCYELPVGYKWEHKKGLTLIGDASSLTAPFSGEGVNKAMKDALELAELVGKSHDPNSEFTFDQAVLDYEHLMFPRAGKLQVAAMNNKQIMFSSDTPVDLISGMVKIKASESSTIFMKIGTIPLVALAYCYFWIRVQIGWAVRRLWRKT